MPRPRDSAVAAPRRGAYTSADFREVILIRSMNHSSFPKIGELPMDQQLRLALRHREHGRATDADVESAVAEVLTTAVAQQSRAFVDAVTDGCVRWNGPVSHLAHGIEHLGTGELIRWFETNFYDRRLVVDGPLKRARSRWADDWRAAADVALTKPVKAVLPGPVLAARLARDRHYGDVDRLADALAGILAEEAAALREAGATWFQIDEPLLCRRPEDLERVARTAGRIFDACGDGATTILSTYFGTPRAVADRLVDLPGTHLGLDATEGDEALELIARLPQEKGVALGLFDARRGTVEDAADVCARLEPHRAQLVGRDVLLGPNAGLELLSQDQAFDKLLHARYAVEQLAKEPAWSS